MRRARALPIAACIAALSLSACAQDDDGPVVTDGATTPVAETSGPLVDGSASSSPSDTGAVTASGPTDTSPLEVTSAPPDEAPVTEPTETTTSPELSGTSAPTTAPTVAPTTAPTGAPTTAPTGAPTSAPTSAPTGVRPTTPPPTTPPPTSAPTGQPPEAGPPWPAPAPGVECSSGAYSPGRIRLGEAASSPEVSGTAVTLMRSATSCDTNTLVALAEEDGTIFSASREPAESALALPDVESRYLAIAVLLSATSPATGQLDTGGEVTYWPAAFRDGATDADWNELVEAGLYTPDEVAQMRPGGYTGWRIGIADDGNWLFFVAGAG